MPRTQNPNLELLQMAVTQLGELANDMVFVGGTATGLLITDPAAPPLRITRDVDAIVEIISRTEFYQLGKRLRHQGFTEDSSHDAPICRWISGDIILDIMPTDERILGFGNQWYSPAIQHAVTTQLPKNKIIRHVSAPYFLITKLAAFTGRGHGDYLMSHDIEDIVTVFDGRPTLLDEIQLSEPRLIAALSNQFKELLTESRFIEAISAHLPPDNISQSRATSVIEKMKTISQWRKPS